MWRFSFSNFNGNYVKFKISWEKSTDFELCISLFTDFKFTFRIWFSNILFKKLYLFIKHYFIFYIVSLFTTLLNIGTLIFTSSFFNSYIQRGPLNFTLFSLISNFVLERMFSIFRFCSFLSHRIIFLFIFTHQPTPSLTSLLTITSLNNHREFYTFYVETGITSLALLFLS